MQFCNDHHPQAATAIVHARDRHLGLRDVVFQVLAGGGAGLWQRWLGKAGWLCVQQVTLPGAGVGEVLVHTAMSDDGEGIAELQRQVRQVQTLDEKLALRRQERDLDRERTNRRRALYDQQDRVDAERDRLLDGLEAAVQAEVGVREVLRPRWRVVGGHGGTKLGFAGPRRFAQANRPK